MASKGKTTPAKPVIPTMQSTPVGVIIEEREMHDDDVLLQKGFQKKDLESAKEHNPLPPKNKLTLAEGIHYVQRRLRSLGLQLSNTYIDSANGNCMFEASMDQLSTVLNMEVPHSPHTMRLQIVLSIVGQEHLYPFNFDEPLEKWIHRMSENGCHADALMLQLISNKYNVNIRVIHVFNCDGESTITPQTKNGYETSDKDIILLYYSEERFFNGHYISVKKTKTKELDLSNIPGEHELSTNELSSLHFNSYSEPDIETQQPKLQPEQQQPEPQHGEPPSKKLKEFGTKHYSILGRTKRTRRMFKPKK